MMAAAQTDFSNSAGQPGGAFDRLTVGIRIGERDVGRDRVVEQQGVLEHETDRTPRVVDAQVAQIDAVEYPGHWLPRLSAG